MKMMCLIPLNPPTDEETVTVAEDVAVLPFPSLAVAVYVVVADGVTDSDPLAACVPLTPVIVTEVAPVEVQLNVELPPGEIDEGEAVSLTASAPETVTVAVAVTLPPGPVAVAV